MNLKSLLRTMSKHRKTIVNKQFKHRRILILSKILINVRLVKRWHFRKVILNVYLLKSNRLTQELKYFAFSQLILGYKQTYN